MQAAKLFKNGRSQAVRLPKDCRLPGKEVYIRKLDGGVVVLIPKKNPWATLLASLDKFSDDFMEQRDQGVPQERKILEHGLR